MPTLNITVRKNPLVTDFTVKVVDADDTPRSYEQSDFTRTAAGVYELDLEDFSAGDYLPVSLTIYGGGSGAGRPAASATFTLDAEALDPRQVASISPGSNQATTAYAYPLSGKALRYAAL